MILIISTNDDPDALRIRTLLRQRGHRVLLVDPSDFPARITLSCHLDHGRVDARIRLNAETVDLTEVRVGWFRHPGRPRAPETVQHADTRRYIEDECKQFMDSVWTTLGCHWFPGTRPTMLLAEHKLRQLAIALELGFSMPETLFTNDPAALLAFHRASPGGIISKLIGSALQRHLPALRRYTEPVRASDLVHNHSVSLAPVLFQRNLSKRVEIRATVVGGQVFAAEIHSQAARRTRQDWRRYNLDRTPHFVHQLPDAVVQRCVALTRRLGLLYGAIDLILTADGRYEFLEINPSGQWQWIEKLTGLPIDAAICELLHSLDPPAQARLSNLQPDAVTESC